MCCPNYEVGIGLPAVDTHAPVWSQCAAFSGIARGWAQSIWVFIREYGVANFLSYIFWFAVLTLSRIITHVAVATQTYQKCWSQNQGTISDLGKLHTLHWDHEPETQLTRSDSRQHWKMNTCRPMYQGFTCIILISLWHVKCLGILWFWRYSQYVISRSPEVKFAYFM